MKVHWLQAGYCLNIGALTRRGAPWTLERYPAGFALIEHPRRGPVLFDTGYHPRFHAATRTFPERAYALMTPVVVGPQDTAAAQLARLGVAPRDVREIILSHFHADHLSGLRDFPSALLRFDLRAYEAVHRLGRVAAVRNAFLRALLPDDFTARARPWGPEDYQAAPPELRPFGRALDLFGDRSAWAVELPGHAQGQTGVILPSEGVFLAADAAWSGRSLRERSRPHPLATLVFQDRQQERRSFEQAADYLALHPEVRVWASHCPEARTGLYSGGTCA